jgi:hypothetical protein
MQKDVYAIYETYVTEGQGPYSYSTTRLPGTSPITSSEAGNTTTTIGPAAAAGARSPIKDLGSNTALYQGEETKAYKSLVRDAEKLLQLIRAKKYTDVVLYCKVISKHAEEAYNKK